MKSGGGDEDKPITKVDRDAGAIGMKVAAREGWGKFWVEKGHVKHEGIYETPLYA